MPVRPQNRVGAKGAMPMGPPSPTVGALWALVGIEVAAIVVLRRYYRKHHGG